MPSPSVITRGIVQRLLPGRWPDDRDLDRPARLGPYGDIKVESPTSKQHLLCDEGAYFVTNNAQAGIASPAIAAWAAVSPACLIQNIDSVGGKSIWLDYMALVTTAAGSWASAGVNIQLMIYLDAILRYSSAGTNLTPNIVNTNMNLGSVKSIASVYFGAIVATAASALVRSVCGLRILRPAVSATVPDVIGELKLLNFGGIDQSVNGSITIANANQITHPAPPCIIGPQQSALIYLVLNGTTPGAASYAPELGWVER